MGSLLLSIFCLLLFLIFLYSLSQLHLLINYLRKKNSNITSLKLDHNQSTEFPCVSIQLPLYNEKEVVERLLRNIARIEYPREKLQIQVLDDSTDESAKLTRYIVEELRQTDIDIEYQHRTVREDFKAGALREGLKTAKGEFIAIFDSDFMPQPDWLYKTLPYFKDEAIGVVQTRWGHLNRNYSLLTRLQAFALDFHFILEQNGRNHGGHFINFNGTAGIWRKSCIEQAGSWEGDTLTEDLDLSYRAQLKGWKFLYLDSVDTPAELPITIEAVRTQQFRWNKGAAENFRKNFSRILRERHVPLKTKLHCFFHLLNSSLFFLVLFLAILSVPVMFLIELPEYNFYFNLMLILGTSTLIFFVSYWMTYSRIHGRSFRNMVSYVGMFLAFFSVAMGFSLHNTRAVLEGHLGRRSSFIRTPKFNSVGEASPLHLRNRSAKKFNFQLLLEILLMAYFAFAVLAAIRLEIYNFLLFHAMLLFGFAFVVWKSIQPFFLSVEIVPLNVKKNNI